MTAATDTASVQGTAFVALADGLPSARLSKYIIFA